MACEITSGYDLVCDSQGGVDTWYAFAIANYDTLTYANGEVTALTLLAGTYAYPLNVEMETSSFTDVAVGERTNGAYGRQQTATVVLHGNTAEMIVEIEALCRGRHALIAKLNDGTYELLFMENGAKATDERASLVIHNAGKLYIVPIYRIIYTGLPILFNPSKRCSGIVNIINY